MIPKRTWSSTSTTKKVQKITQFSIHIQAKTNSQHDVNYFTETSKQMETSERTTYIPHT